MERDSVFPLKVRPLSTVREKPANLPSMMVSMKKVKAVIVGGKRIWSIAILATPRIAMVACHTRPRIRIMQDNAPGEGAGACCVSHRDGGLDYVVPVVRNGGKAESAPRGENEEALDIKVRHLDCSGTKMRIMSARQRVHSQGQSEEILTARHMLRQQVAEYANNKSGRHFGGKGLGLEEVEVLGPVALRQAATPVAVVAAAAAPAAKMDTTAYSTRR